MVDVRCARYFSMSMPSGLMRPTCAPVGSSPGSDRRASIASSTSSASLRPPRAKNLMPLSGIALWLAEIITPKSASMRSVRKATAGVGTTPMSMTVTPALARPAQSAACRNSPLIRGSRPTTATERSLVARTCAAATPKDVANCAVRSPLARPRTPSVPNRRDDM